MTLLTGATPRQTGNAAMQSIKLNGQHIGSVAKTATGWKAWSALRRVTVNGATQTFTAKTKRQCVDWLESIAE